MRRRVKILLWTPILLFFIGSGLIFLLFSTHFWKKPIINIINNRLLKKFELQINVKRIEGNVFSNLELVDAELQTIRKNTILRANRIKVSFNLNTMLSPQPELLGLELDGGEFSFPKSIDTLQYLFSKNKKEKKTSTTTTTTTVKEPTSWKFDFGITNFTYFHNNEPYHVELLFGDLCSVEDQLDVNLDTANFYIKENIDVFTLSKAKIHSDKSGFSLDHLLIKNYNSDLMADLNFPIDSCGCVNIIANNIRPINYLPQFNSEFAIDDFLNLICKIEIEDSIKIFADFIGQLRSNPIENGKIIASVNENNLNITKFHLDSDDEYVDIDFKSSSSKKHSGNLSIGKINLEKWEVATTKTSLTGKSHFDIRGKLDNPKSITAAIDFSETGVDTLNLSKVKGKLVFSDQILTIQDKIIARLEDNIFTLTGNTNFKSKELKIDCSVNAADISIFSPLLNAPELKGTILGNLQIRGKLDDPAILGELSATDIGLPELFFDETRMKFGMLDLISGHHGTMVLNAKNGSTKFINVPFPILNLDVTFEQDITNIRQLKVEGDDFSLYLKGKIIGFKDITVETLQGNLRSNNFANITPMNVLIDGTDITISPTYLVVNNSQIQLQALVQENQLANARAKITNLNLSSINDFLPKEHHVAGFCSGQFNYNTKKDSQEIDLSLTGKDLIYKNDHFNKMNCQLSLVNNRITIPEISLTDSTNGFVSGSGYFTCNFPTEKGQKFIDKTSQLNIELDFNNFDLSILNTYVLYNTKLGGKLVGDVKFTNTINKPNIETAFYILDPLFDKVQTKNLRVNAKVENSMIQISDIYLTDEAGSYYGKGTCPLEISLLDGIFTVAENGELDMNVFSEISSIPALPQYIQEIQSVKGDMIFNMKLSGPPLKPVASGKFEMIDGELKVSDLENSIYGLNGVGIIENNVLTIEEFTGQMKNRNFAKLKNRFARILENLFTRRVINPNASNVNFAGTIDLNDIAKPDINLAIEGKDIYIRTLLGEQEGIADAKVKIIGKDSLKIDGDILMKNFTVRNELVAVGETYKEVKPSALYTDINFHLTSPGNFFIKNSVMECELKGEGWMFKEGDDDFRISGDFSIIDGILSYQGIWEFTDLQGNILFIPTELNPTLDIQAKLDLAGMQGSDNSQNPQTSQDQNNEGDVTVFLTGDLEKPDLQFESEIYSQSDILRILTFTYDNSERNVTDTGLDLAGAYLQRQLNRNVSKYTGLDEFQLKTQGNLLQGEFDSQISLMMGRRITNNLYLTYERGFDEDQSDPTNSFGLRYRFDQKKSLSGQIDNNGLFDIKYRFRHHY